GAPLFPYTTLFRSALAADVERQPVHVGEVECATGSFGQDTEVHQFLDQCEGVPGVTGTAALAVVLPHPAQRFGESAPLPALADVRRLHRHLPTLEPLYGGGGPGDVLRQLLHPDPRRLVEALPDRL